jgi:hypothetical protein
MQHTVLAAAAALSWASVGVAEVVVGEAFAIAAGTCPVWSPAVGWDLNGDRVADACYAAPCCDCSAGCSSSLTPAPGGNIGRTEVDAGGLIGSGLDWGDGLVWGWSAGGCGGGIGCDTPGIPVFVAVRFHGVDGLHYGWLRVYYEPETGFLSFLDYAYEADPDTAIRAGAGLLIAPDIDGDGVVGGADLGLLLGRWTDDAAHVPCEPPPAGDLNADCRVNALDLELLLSAWGPMAADASLHRRHTTSGVQSEPVPGCEPWMVPSPSPVQTPWAKAVAVPPQPLRRSATRERWTTCRSTTGLLMGTTMTRSSHPSAPNIWWDGSIRSQSLLPFHGRHRSQFRRCHPGYSCLERRRGSSLRPPAPSQRVFAPRRRQQA